MATMTVDIEVNIPALPADEGPKTVSTDLGCTDFKDVVAPAVPKDPPSMSEKRLTQDDLETPPSLGTLEAPPPPYSQQWDDLNLILQRSREVLNGHSEYLAKTGGTNKDAGMLEKMTQLESLVSSLQVALSTQTFAMADLRTQLSDIQSVLKKMENKQDSITSDELLKQVVTIKTLTESLKHRLDEGSTPAHEEPVADLQEEEKHLAEEQGQILVTTDDAVSNMAIPVIGNTQSAPSPTPMSRTTSRHSRPPSRGGSRSASRTVSPTRPPMSRSSSKVKLDIPDIPGSPYVAPQRPRTTIEPISELEDKNDQEFEGESEIKGEAEGEGESESKGEDDEEDAYEDESFLRMRDLLSSLITEATTAVEAPVKGREKKLRQFSNASIESRDILEDFDWDALADDNEGEENDAEREETKSQALVTTNKERAKKEHKRQKSKKEEELEEELEESMKKFDSTMQCLMADLTGSVIQEDNGAVIARDKDGIIRELTVNYADDTQDLINNPSGDLADLDDFAQQCRLLTRALILPFLHATHSFMSESLKATNNPNSPKTLTSTTRTFMNLMYWTFLFTLGSLVLDAWLCEVAGRQVIRMVDMLKPTQPFGLLNNSYSSYNSGYSNPQQFEYIQGPPDGGVRLVEDGKKKNVNFRTGLRLRNAGWRGMRLGVGRGKRWLKESAKGVIQLGRRGGRFLAGGTWGDEVFDQTSCWDDDDLCSDASDEWEIVDWFDSSTDEEDDDDETDTAADESSSTEDSAIELRRRITKERLRRAGHVAFTSTSAPSPADQQDCTCATTTKLKGTANPIENEPTEHSSDPAGAQASPAHHHDSCAPPKVLSIDTARKPDREAEGDEPVSPASPTSPVSPLSACSCDDDDTLELPIPGSFPAEFRWQPTSPTFDFNDEEDTRTRRRRVRSVIVHRPRGELWMVKARKLKSASRSKRNSVVDASTLTAPLHKKSASPSSMSKRKKRPSLSIARTWERRNSI